jgi:hypothetical protein
VIRYTPLRPFLLRLNDTGGGVDDLLPPPPQPAEAPSTGKPSADAGAGQPGGGTLSSESDAVIGGRAGNTGAVASARANPPGPAQVADTAYGAEG